MKKKILNKALSLILPHFVENFDKKALESLNENQKIVQSDLLFKPDFFLFLGFPFLIDSGSIKQFSITVDQNNFVTINVSNVDIVSTITRIPETNKTFSDKFLNKIIKRFISNINFSIVIANLVFHINSNFDLQINQLKIDSNSKSSIIGEKTENFISLLFTANNFSFNIKDKIILNSSFDLALNLPLGSNQEKQILFKTNEFNINLSSETIPLFVMLLKNIFNSASNSQSTEFITLSILDEDNNISSPRLNEIEEEEEDSNNQELNLSDVTKWNFNFEFNSISFQFEEESKIIISNAIFKNDLISISKVSIINNLQNSIQYTLSFIETKFNIKEKKFIIQKLEEEEELKLISIKQINKENNFLSSNKNENENKLDFYADEIEFNGSFDFFLNWISIQLRTIDLFFNIINDLSSSDQNETENTNLSSSGFTDATDFYDYSNDSSADLNNTLSSSNSKIINATFLSEFMKKLISNAYSIGVTFPLFKMTFNSGFSSHLSVHLFFSLKKRSYQIFGSDCHLSFKNFEPISTNLSFQMSVQRNLINAFISPSDFRFTEDESLLLFYGFVNHLKMLFDQIQAIDLRKKNLKKKGLLTKRFKMTIVTFNLILCRNVLIQNDSTCLRKNSFLMISSKDISLSASNVRDKISVNIKCFPSLSFWNAKTSFWDFVVNPFNLNVSIIYKNGIVHFDAEIPSSIELNVTPLLVDCLLPKCSENYAGIDLSKFSPTNLTLQSLKNRTDEIMQKYISSDKQNESLNSNNEDNERVICFGSESISIYNGFGYPIPINIINDLKPSKASSMPSLIKINDKNIEENSQLSISTVTAEEHRKINELKKDNKSTINLKSDMNSNDTNVKLQNDNDEDSTIVLENGETKLIPNATIDSIIYFPSLNESIKISHIKCEIIIHSELVIIPSFTKQSNPNFGKLIKLLPRFEIQNMTKYPLKFILFENNELESKYKSNCFTIQSNSQKTLNEIQCRNRISIIDEKTDLASFSRCLNGYSSNLTDKRSNYSLVKLHSSSSNNKKYIKKENDINHSNERNIRENLLLSTNFFIFSTIPNIYEYNINNSMISKCYALKLTNPVSSLNKVLEVRPLFAIRNDLPFEVICTFVSESKNSVTTVSVNSEEMVNLDDFNSNIECAQFTACVLPYGISKTVKTAVKGIDFSTSQKVTPFTQILQKEIIEIPSKKDQNKILLSFYMTFSYCEKSGQFIFYLFSPIVIVNKTEIPSLFINDGQNIHEFDKCNFPIASNEKENTKIFPTFIINSPILNGESTSLSISSQEEGPFVLLPQMSQFLNVSAGKNIIYPFYVEYRKLNELVTYYEIRPRLSIINKMPFDLIFTCKAKQTGRKMSKIENENEDKKEKEFSFVVKPNEEKTVIKCRNDISFSVSPPKFPSIDEFAMQIPMSTVFRFSNEEDEEEVVQFQLDKNNDFKIGIFYENSNLNPNVSQSLYFATFKPASIWMPCPTMFVIVNNIPNYPIHAQQCENSMPIRIAPNSTSLFPFDSPFSTPVVMITIAGKSQLIPLQNEIKATLFPFKLGSEKIYADLIVLSSGDGKIKNSKSVQALIIGYQPYYFAPKEEDASFTFNPYIKTYNFTFNLIAKELCVSFFNDNLEEFILVNVKLIKTEMTSNKINISIDSVQVDDQISFVKDTVIFKSKNNTTNSMMQKAMNEMKQINSLQNESVLNSPLTNSVVEDDENNNDNNEMNSKLDWSINISSQSFFQLSLIFDFSLLNAQSLAILIQPFDIVIDPTFVQDFIVYFSRLFENRKFLINDGLIYLQDFIMHPMNAHVLCKEIEKRRVHFSSENEGNDLHCKFNNKNVLTNQNKNQKIQIGSKISHNLRNLLLSPFQTEKRCSVAINSLVCHDLNMRLSAILDILSRHLSFFTKNALSYFTNLIYTEKPEVSFSLFQASFAISEFYDISNVRINHKNDKISKNDLSVQKNKDLTSNIGVNSYLNSVIRITNLHPTDVFPVFSCSSNMVIDYKAIYLIVQDSTSLLASSSSSSLISNSANSKNIDSNSNSDLFTSSSSLTNYRFDVGNRISPQKLFVMNKIQPLTAEMVGIETLVKKSIVNQSEKKKFEKICFLDYCGSMNTIIVVTETFFFIYALPSFNLVSRFLLSNIVDVKLNKNRIIIQLKKLSKWKSNDPVILIDLIDDDIAAQLKLIIETLLTQQNKFV